MSERVNKFLGDTPAKTLVRPFDYLIGGRHHHEHDRTEPRLICGTKLQDFALHLYELGFDAIWRIARYFVWGAMVVVPVFLLVRLIKFSR